MSVLALVEPTTLVGEELREQLGRVAGTAEVRLLTAEEERFGTVTEVAGGAALIQPMTPESLAGVDLVIVCAEAEAALAALPAGATAIVIATGDRPVGMLEAPALVAGVSLDLAERAGVNLSPHPVVVALAQLLHPLEALGAYSAVATVVLPVSLHGKAGLDELLEQTRSLLAFRSEVPREVLGRRLAHNLLPAAEDDDRLLAQLSPLLPNARHLALRSLAGGLFHGVSLSVHVAFGEDPGRGVVEEALAAGVGVEAVDDPQAVGPVDAAARRSLLVGPVAADPGRDGAYWLWSAIDNLVRGGAANAVEIARRLLPGAFTG